MIKSSLVYAALAAASLTGAALAQESAPSRPAAPELALAIADQGNRALRQIRAESTRLTLAPLPDRAAPELAAPVRASPAAVAAASPEPLVRWRSGASQ